MAKRFTDSELWNKDWFLDLSIKQKLLVKYIFDNCDIAGFLEISFRTLSFVFGEKVTREDFDGLKQIKFINENTVFVEDFIKFQNNVEIEDLNPNYSVHKGILKKLNKYNGFVTLKDPCQDLQCETSNGSIQVKVKVKDKVIVKNKEEEEKKENLTKEKKENSFSDPYSLYNFIREKWKKKTDSECFLNTSEVDKLFSLYIETEDFLETFNKVCEVMEALRYLWRKELGFSPGLNWLLKDNFKNYSDVRNGTYDSKIKEFTDQFCRDLELKELFEKEKSYEQATIR
jgi:hypothetical protein